MPAGDESGEDGGRAVPGPAMTELSDSLGLVTRPDPAGTSPQRDTRNIIKTSLPQVCDFSFSSVGASPARSGASPAKQ